MSGRRGNLRRGARMALVVVLLLALLTQTVLAFPGAMLGNTEEENQSILSALSNSTGMDVSEVSSILQELGLLDKDGNLVTNESIVVDGVEMSLEQVKTMLADENVDLDKVVTVDGTELTLRNLQTMIQIEDQIMRIQQEYFSGREMSWEQQLMYQDLMEQLTTQGLQLDLSLMSAFDASQIPTTANHKARIMVTASDTEYTVGSSTQTLTLTFTLTDDTGAALAEALDYPVSFSWRIAEGSALSGTHFSATTGTATIPAGTKSITKTVTINAGPDVNDPTNGAWRWNGNKMFYVQVYDPENILIYRDASNSAAVATEFVITLKQSFSWPAPHNVTLRSLDPDPYSFDSAALSYSYNVIKGTVGEYAGKWSTSLMPNTEVTKTEGKYDFSMPYTITRSIYPTSAAACAALRVLAADNMLSKFKFYYDSQVTTLNGITSADLRWDLEFDFNGDGTAETSLPNQLLTGAMEGDYTEAHIVDINLTDAMRSYLADAATPTIKIPLTFQVLNEPSALDSVLVSFYRTLNTNDVVPLYNETYNVVGYKNDGYMDEAAPTVKSVTVSSGTYYPGNTVPVKVVFSEPVNSSGITLTINGTNVSPAEGATTQSSVLTFPYTVKAVDGTNIQISRVSGVKDLAERPYYRYSGDQFLEGWESSPNPMAAANETLDMTLGTLDSTYLKDAIASVYTVSADTAASFGTSSPADMAALPALDDYPAGATDGAVVIAMNSELSDKYETMIGNLNTPGNPTVTAKILGADKSVLKTVDMSKGSTANSKLYLYGSFALPETEGIYGVQVYADDVLIVGQYTGFRTVPPIPVQAGDITITYPLTWPSGTANEMYLASAVSVSLGYDYTNTNNATYTDEFYWVSNNPDVATIDQTGLIAPVSEGDVTFTIYAKDGEAAESDWLANASKTSASIKIRGGNEPSLVVPAGFSPVRITEGQDAAVFWGTNITYINQNRVSPAVATTYTLKLFATDSRGLKTGEAIKTYTLDIPADGEAKSGFVIPAADMTLGYSTEETPLYVVEISAAHPHEAGRILTAGADIVVYSKPAQVKLTALGNYSLLDTGSANIQWNMDQYDSNGGEFELLITKNNAEVYRLTDPGAAVGGQQYSGSYQLKFTDVTGDRVLKDVYTVTLKAKNPADNTWSYDSYIISVYDAGALKIQVDGQTVSVMTLDNESWISVADMASTYAKPSTMTTDEIMALRDTVKLRRTLSINSGQYDWNILDDMIKWKSSDESVATVNYQRGALYENISNYSYDAYLANTEFALSAFNDGDTVITATHAKTGQPVELSVNVLTMKDKFYIFQMVPMVETALTYTNGDGDVVQISTNDKGALALYEPSGIVSDVACRSEETVFGKTKIYMGTIYNQNLVSGEKDSTRLILYPLNSFKLNEIAMVEVYIKTPDGNPYTGAITLRGGVYKNNAYCPTAMINYKDGCADQTVDIGSNGLLSIEMDPMQFYTESEANDTPLLNSDKLEFIFEAQFAGDAYYPILVYSSGNLNPDDVVRAGDTTVSLETANGKQPFVARQTVTYSGTDRPISVRNGSGNIGPSSAYPEVTLDTTTMVWGVSMPTDLTYEQVDGSYATAIVDNYGIKPVQSSYAFAYPFSTFPLVYNTIVMNKETIWMGDRELRSVDVKLFNRAGTMVQDSPLSFQVTNMLETVKVDQDAGIAAAKDDIQESGIVGGFENDKGDDMVRGAMDFIGGTEITGVPFKMVISPTESPTAFKAFIWAGFSQLDSEIGGSAANGVFLEAEAGSAGELNPVPSVGDLVNMTKGTYESETNKTLDKAESNVGKTTYDASPQFQLEGYFEAMIQYNYTDRKWEILVLGGGFTAGVGVEFTWNYNQFVGPVPVTAYLKLGGSIQLDFKAAVRYRNSQAGDSTWADTVTSDTVNDYLTTLRIDAYVKAFAGIGFDYTVVALKIGIFGKIDLDNQNAFLSRTYLANPDEEQIEGQSLKLTGTVGIEFKAQFLVASYEKVLASVSAGAQWTFNDWNKMWDYWDDAATSYLPSQFASMELMEISSTATLESRDYLAEYDRSWGGGDKEGFFSLLELDDPKTTSDMETNTYPNANPLLTEDGKILAYLHDNDSVDVSDTTAKWTVRKTDGSFEEGAAIDDPKTSTALVGYGDTGLSLAGDKEMAVAAWVRQSYDPQKEAGEELTTDDQAMMVNSAEAMVSIYDGSSWDTTRLSSNSAPDLSPVVATNGEMAVVFWRSVSVPDPEAITDFGRDYILYKIYNGIAWGETQTLYNGTSGSIMGLQAAMLSDGSSAAVYTLAKNPKPDSAADYEAYYNSYEIVYAVIDDEGTVVRNVQATSDEYLDENPQIAAVNFGTGDQRFVIGWHSVQEASGVPVSDIRLAAVNNQGIIAGDFMDSISQVADAAAVNIAGDFRFVKMSEYNNSIENLSLIWSEPRLAVGSEVKDYTVDRDQLKAVKFIKYNNSYGISAAMDVAGDIGEQTKVDQFDAFVSDAGINEIKAVLLLTEYQTIELGNPATYTAYCTASGSYAECTDAGCTEQHVYVAKSISSLRTATETYENAFEVTAVSADYDSLMVNAPVAVQFTVANKGMEPIDKLTFTLGGKQTGFNDLTLLPNQSRVFTLYHVVGAVVEDTDYSVSADFTGSDDPAALTGPVYLDIADVGISKVETIEEKDGVRTVQLTLYNASDATLAGSGRHVALGIYDELDYKTCVDYKVNGVSYDEPYDIDDDEDLALIDAGAYTMQFTFDLGSYVGAGNEIPKSGLILYFNAVIKTPDPNSPSLKKSEVNYVDAQELHSRNNQSSLNLRSLLNFSDPSDLVIKNVIQGTSGDPGSEVTTADITIKNRSLVQTTGGNLVASLLDAQGNVLESWQSYDPAEPNNGLITLGKEAEITMPQIKFSQPGASVEVGFTDTILTDDTVTDLNALTFNGLTVDLSSFNQDPDSGKYVADGGVSDSAEILVRALSKDPRVSVTIGGQPAPNGSYNVPLTNGENIIPVVITSADGNHTRTFELTVSYNAPRSGGGGSPGYSVTATFGEGGTVTPSGNVKVAGNADQAFIITPNTGYLISDVKVDGVSVGAVDSYTFAKVIKNHTLEAVFAVDPNYVPEDHLCAAFTDIAGHWAESDICYVVENGLFNGTSATTFQPQGTMNRAMMTTALWRLEGSPETGSHSFSDVKTGDWYDKAVGWAFTNGVVRGVSDDGFDPMAPITREQMVTMLYRYAEYKEYDVTGEAELSAFNDSSSVASYALNSMKWAVASGLITGTNAVTLSPDSYTNRAQVSAVFHRYAELLSKTTED